ncbi:MAG: hypothetical protein V4672_11445 [Verrucomicrobiota bacterium]
MTDEAGTQGAACPELQVALVKRQDWILSKAMSALPDGTLEGAQEAAFQTTKNPFIAERVF